MAAVSIALTLLVVNAATLRAAAPPRTVRVAVLGDSLAAGYGLPAGEAFPARLEEALRARGLPVTVENAGVSGDTSAGGLARLEWVLGSHPDVVLVELGGNDALRGLPPAELEANLDRILATLTRRGVRPLLAGMRAPRNLGPEYVTRFDAVYPRLAAKYDVPLYPFFLEGVAGVPALNQPDGIHPNPKGVAVIVGRIAPGVADLVRRVLAEPDP